MAPPTVDQSAPFQKCNGDSLQVGNITLCGENSGQHSKLRLEIWVSNKSWNERKSIFSSCPVYIPINPRQGERQLAITINTRNGNGNGNGMARSNWNIAVHQLECPFGQSRSLNVAEAPEVVGPSRNPRAFVSEWLAPAGCLQYFVHPTGTLESFNFNNGIGPYIGDMNYAICFRRQRGHNMLKWVTWRQLPNHPHSWWNYSINRLLPTFFRLNSGNPANAGLNEDCFDQIQTQLRSEDYLFIPNAELSDVPPTRARLFCGQSPISKIITSTPPGPFMMTFNADRVYSPTEEIGFRMQYEIL